MSVSAVADLHYLEEVVFRIYSLSYERVAHGYVQPARNVEYGLTSATQSTPSS